MNSLAKYRYINAEQIVKANIRHDHITEDVDGVLSVLKPIIHIAKPESLKPSTLHRNVIERLNSKSHMLDLLKHFGFVRNGDGKYIYQATSPSLDMQLEAMEEFRRFLEDLGKIKNGSLNGFQEYIKNTQKPAQTNQRIFDEDPWEERSRPTSQLSFRDPSPPPSSIQLPSSSKVNEGNDKTRATIKAFKEEIASRSGTGDPVAHSFIRRKLLLLLFEQLYPDAKDFGDENIDAEVEQRLSQLRREDKHTESGSSMEVYYECLLRAGFNRDTALHKLRHDRPNLKPPPEPQRPPQQTTTTLENCLPHLEELLVHLNDDTDENGSGQMLLQEGDEWKNAVHVVTSIIELRTQYDGQPINDTIFSRMYRLIYSELSHTVGEQSTAKLEILARILCEIPLTTLEHLNMADIKDVVHSNNNAQLREDFEENARKSLAMECQICTDTFPRSRMETMFLCDHTCCLSCAKEYYRGAIKDARSSETLNLLTCFDTKEEIFEEIKLNFFQYLETKLNQWFTDERLVLEQYHENLFIATRGSTIKKCGNPKCRSFFDTHHANNVRAAQCPHCRFQQCQQCCRKWYPDHAQMNCEDYVEWLKDNDLDDPNVQLMKYLDTAGMMCPNGECQTIYEYKPGGCEHFKCKTCRAEFCRVCSTLFCNPERNTTCTRPNCLLRGSLHAHCPLNCFRELRDFSFDAITQVLEEHGIAVAEELQLKPVADGIQCPVEDCKEALSVLCGNRFCERCYKEFLCLLVWRNSIEPWDIYDENSLRQKLLNALVPVPPNATKADLTVLAQQNLTQFLGRPKKLPRLRT